jgi:hypothetical protein
MLTETWQILVIQDNTPQPKFFGTGTVTKISGDASINGAVGTLSLSPLSFIAGPQSGGLFPAGSDRRVLWWTIAGAAAIFVYTLITLGIYVIRSHRLGCFRCSPGLR